MKIRKITMNRIFLLMMIMLISSSLLTGCGSGEAKTGLVGKWEAVDHEGEVLNFNNDGTYMYTTTNGNNASGSYKVSDNEIQMTSDASGLGADLNKVSGLHEFTLEGNELSFSELGFASTEYSKVK